MSRPDDEVAIVVAGHGDFALGLASAVDLIIGPQDNFATVSLPAEESPSDFLARLREAIEDIDSGAGVVVLADLPGATPFSTAARIAHERGGVEVIGGANLPMVLEALVRRQGRQLDDLVKIMAEAGPAGIIRWSPPSEET
ncbi:PTS sugar transporter subunit IIA [Kibdelosporangium aridum]|uniref:PTS system N-acetylgalactosamine-specific EIIA component, Man family n=1 Tax=Kibdelosporangium aridum TaxID=2030 RepID=A0A1W2B7I8_KIBAR|nr:PTS sugar transporter subunit IIA [Kibdelosporangium aridum]SMC68925.1 PTS system N-acetylgalactosamine-specific EIIA component, Man family [Kibdelosporangium aridum]